MKQAYSALLHYCSINQEPVEQDTQEQALIDMEKLEVEFELVKLQALANRK